MKQIINFLIVLVCLLGYTNCTNDSAENPIFADDELYIYTDYAKTLTGTVGVPFTYKILTSPADNSVTVEWLLDGQVISQSNTLTYTINEAGSYQLRFVAYRNGITNSRDFTLEITNSK